MKSYKSKSKSTLLDSSPSTGTYDTLVLSCHPDQALALLGEDSSSQERDALSLFTYSNNGALYFTPPPVPPLTKRFPPTILDCFVHSDESLMPKSRAAWTSWNYIGGGTGEQKPVFVTYYLNKLQSLQVPRHSKFHKAAHYVAAPATLSCVLDSASQMSSCL